MPWPSSALPVKTVMPSASTRIQASSMGVVRRLPGRRGGCGRPDGSCAMAARASEKLTTSAPPPASSDGETARRAAALIAVASCAAAGSCADFIVAGGAAHGGEDAHVRAAAAEVGAHVLADLLVRGCRIASQQRLRAHDHAGDAVAALRRLLVDEGPLQRRPDCRWCRGPSSVVMRRPRRPRPA